MPSSLAIPVECIHANKARSVLFCRAHSRRTSILLDTKKNGIGTCPLTLAKRSMSMLESELIKEDRSLRWSWDQYPAEHLDRYLVQGIEDPRINCQSILTRALIVDTLWPGEFDALINDELRFGAVLVWLTEQLRAQVTGEEILQALHTQNARVPTFVSETWT